MAATRKLQGEEKVLPACLHLDISLVPVSCRGRRCIGLDESSGSSRAFTLCRRSPAIQPSRRFCESRQVAPPTRRDHEQHDSRHTTYREAPIQRHSPNGYNGLQ